MVQANNKKLENIEKFLETLGCQIESFLTSDLGKLTKANKRTADLVRKMSQMNEFCLNLPKVTFFFITFISLCSSLWYLHYCSLHCITNNMFYNTGLFSCFIYTSLPSVYKKITTNRNFMMHIF